MNKIPFLSWSIFSRSQIYLPQTESMPGSSEAHPAQQRGPGERGMGDSREEVRCSLLSLSEGLTVTTQRGVIVMISIKRLCYFRSGIFLRK